MSHIPMGGSRIAAERLSPGGPRYTPGYCYFQLPTAWSSVLYAGVRLESPLFGTYVFVDFDSASGASGSPSPSYVSTPLARTSCRTERSHHISNPKLRPSSFSLLLL